MLAVLAYLRAADEGAPRRGVWWIATFCCFAAALLSKAVAVSLPAVLVLLDVHPLRRLGGGRGRWLGPGAWPIWREKVPLAALGVGFTGLAFAARVDERHRAVVQSQGIAARVAQACFAVWFYLAKTVAPVHITAYYPTPERVRWDELPFLLCVLATLGVSVAVLTWGRRRPALMCAWFSYLVILAPNSGLVPIASQIAADRYSYMAMMGLMVLLAAGLCRGLRAARRRNLAGVALATTAAAIVLGLVVLTRAQCRTWQTSERLWVHVVNHGGGRSFMARNILGAVLLAQGRDDDAVAQLIESLRLKPDHASTHYNLGLVLSRRGRAEAALAHYGEAVRLDPDHVDARSNLGVALSRQGRLVEAAAQFAEVVRREPDHAIAHNNLGVILSRQGRLAEAVAQFTECLRLDPDNAEARHNRARIFAAHPEAVRSP
jgi:tetratricopeptide (TPR) repeat protein